MRSILNKKNPGVLIGGTVLCLLLSGGAWAESLHEKGAENRRPPLSSEKMEAIRACAKAKGVELPPPPLHNGERNRRHEAPPSEEKGAENPPPRPQGGAAHEPKKLTDEERAVLDACFTANGVKPPEAPPQPPDQE